MFRASGASSQSAGERASRAPRGPVRARRAAPLEEVCRGMVVRSLQGAAADVVFVKGRLGASDGLANLFAERGGEIVLVAPPGRGAELAELVADLEVELGARTTAATRLDATAEEEHARG